MATILWKHALKYLTFSSYEELDPLSEQLQINKEHKGGMVLNISFAPETRSKGKKSSVGKKTSIKQGNE